MGDIIDLTAVIWFKKVGDIDRKSFTDMDKREGSISPRMHFEFYGRK